MPWLTSDRGGARTLELTLQSRRRYRLSHGDYSNELKLSCLDEERSLDLANARPERYHYTTQEATMSILPTFPITSFRRRIRFLHGSRILPVSIWGRCISLASWRRVMRYPQKSHNKYDHQDNGHTLADLYKNHNFDNTGGFGAGSSHTNKDNQRFSSSKYRDRFSSHSGHALDLDDLSESEKLRLILSEFRRREGTLVDDPMDMDDNYGGGDNYE
ncbi:hypothetical protein SK128_009724 [Halocaridina rubra]|uniref:Uncharacterized protein n=1 Tax=Halocaridina rubra TaxID=373956 RepID=A0AAN8ZTQ1_HALRR